MNSLYNQALRQFSSIQSDIARIDSDPDSSSTAFGPVTVSLQALDRTIDEYENLAKKELIQSKQEKALNRVSKFRTDYKELQSQLARLKTKGSLSSQNGNSSPTTARPPGGPSASFGNSANRRSSAIAESPFSLHARTAQANSPLSQQYGSYPPSQQQQQDPLAAYKMNASAAAMFGGGNGSGGFSTRESHALREHSFIEQTEAQLDAFIAQGREVFGNLVEQRGILKGTQRRLRDAANTLGLSRDVIGYIERRSTQDNIIFAVGAILTLVCFYYIYKWFG
ncbi:V-snare-domain-containing protein [Testicularia cyperi]|uniref:Protein transport protein BOS1 n=1 Tax=Testicularia cyperi TaxID=1882483 RepID=A0A317XTL1_9BASI|nr:V-snare-domain-containing protein [Testicularia cyperi]